MKTIRLFAVSAAVLMTVACGTNASTPKASADSLKAAKSLMPEKALLDSVSYYLGINYGQMLKQYDFGDLDYNLMVKGMKDFVAAQGNPADEDFTAQFKLNPEDMNEAINKYLGQRSDYLAAIAEAEAKKFFVENAKKEGVQETESGLQYKIINAGNDVKPAPVDTVWVNYCGKLIDGTVFDETPEGAEPIRMQLNRVIKGWTEGLQLIGEGGEIELYIPSELGYGEQGNQAIEPNSTLIFNVKLDKVGKVAE
mgnify:CR=1 FL=1